MKVRFISCSNLTEEQLIKLHSLAEFKSYDHNVTDYNEEEVADRIGDADIALVNHMTPVTSRVLDKCGNLKFIISSTIGTDHIDLPACKKKNIRVKWFPGYCARTLAEHNFTMILAGLNRIAQGIMDVRTGNWNYMGFCAREWGNCNLLILGLGKTGSIVKNFADAFGMRVDWVNSQTPPDAVDRKIQAADIISINMSLNDQTRLFLNKKRIGLMKKNVVLVNTARGALVDEPALWKFMSDNPDAVALLDVLTKEPPDARHPALSMKNVFVTPHIGWHSQESKKFIWDEVYKSAVLAIQSGWDDDFATRGPN